MQCLGRAFDKTSHWIPVNPVPETTPHNQKRTLTLAALALTALLCICGALAYTVSTAPADNVIGFGSVKVRVCEYALDAQGREVPFEPDERGEYPETKATSDDISRIVRFQNAGAQSEYVRARLSMKAVAPDETSSDASGNVVFGVHNGEGAAWVDGGDGWYYYRGNAAHGGQLEPGAATENLMDSLRFTGDFHDAARGGRYKLQIEAQAVQAKNQNTDDAFLDVLDVAGWPEAR